MMYRLLIFLFAFSLFAEEPKKVVCATVPKAGTHLVKKAIQLITGKKPPWLTARHLKRPDFEEQFLNSKDDVHIAHLFPDIAPFKDFRPDRVTKILLIRDPRDILLSFAHHLASKNWPFAKSAKRARETFKSLSWDQRLEAALLFPPLTPKDAFPHALIWMRDPQILVLRFEDLIGPKGGGTLEAQRQTLRTLASCMGYTLSLEQIDDIAEKLFGGTWTFRNGQIGEWRTAYSESNKALFNELLGWTLTEFGYTNDLNW